MATLRSVFVLSESDRGAPEQVCVCNSLRTQRSKLSLDRKFLKGLVEPGLPERTG